MMDEGIQTEEKIEKIDQYTQQLYNSGYAWPQIRDIIVSSLKGLQKLELKRREKGENKYRTGEQSLESRIRKKLTETTEWYKKTEEEKIEEKNTEENRAYKEKTWREWRKKKKWKRIFNREKNDGKESEKKEEGEKLQGILFVAHTKNGLGIAWRDLKSTVG